MHGLLLPIRTTTVASWQVGKWRCGRNAALRQVVETTYRAYWDAGPRYQYHTAGIRDRRVWLWRLHTIGMRRIYNLAPLSHAGAAPLGKRFLAGEPVKFQFVGVERANTLCATIYIFVVAGMALLLRGYKVCEGSCGHWFEVSTLNHVEKMLRRHDGPILR